MLRQTFKETRHLPETQHTIKATSHSPETPSTLHRTFKETKHSLETQHTIKATNHSPETPSSKHKHTTCLIRPWEMESTPINFKDSHLCSLINILCRNSSKRPSKSKLYSRSMSPSHSSSKITRAIKAVAEIICKMQITSCNPSTRRLTPHSRLVQLRVHRVHRQWLRCNKP